MQCPPPHPAVPAPAAAARPRLRPASPADHRALRLLSGLLCALSAASAATVTQQDQQQLWAVAVGWAPSSRTHPKQHLALPSKPCEARNTAHRAAQTLRAAKPREQRPSGRSELLLPCQLHLYRGVQHTTPRWTCKTLTSVSNNRGHGRSKWHLRGAA